MDVLIRKSLPLSIQHTQTDPHGRFSVLMGTGEGATLNFISIYVPPRLHNQVLAELGALLLALPSGTLVAGGDNNAIMDRACDSWPARDSSSM